MTYVEFSQMIKQNVPPGIIIKNPKKGTTKIIKYVDEKLVYQRGKLKIYVSLGDFFKSYVEFLETQVSSTELRKFQPKVYDVESNGHPCNCTVLFLILQRSGLVDDIHGKGVRGDPYWVFIRNQL